MFEALVSLCIDVAAGPCRDRLLPGFEAETLAGCEAKLAGVEPREGPPPFCAPVGRALGVEEVVPGVFVHAGRIEEPDAENAGDVANLAFVVGEAGVAVIDTGGALWVGEAMWRSIRARTNLPVTHVVLTHMHPDHVLGASVFAETGARIVGHEHLSRALADRAANYLESIETLIGTDAFLGTVTPEVNEAVSGSLTIDIGGRALDVTAWPAAHTGTDVTVVDRESGLLFAGDLVFQRHTPALDGSLAGWRAVLDDLTTRAFTGVVPGHGAALLPWPDGAADLERYLAVLEADTRAAVAAGMRLGEAVGVIAGSEAGSWDLFDAYNARNATVAFTELEWE